VSHRDGLALTVKWERESCRAFPFSDPQKQSTSNAGVMRPFSGSDPLAKAAVHIVGYGGQQPAGAVRIQTLAEVNAKHAFFGPDVLLLLVH